MTGLLEQLGYRHPRADEIAAARQSARRAREAVTGAIVPAAVLGSVPRISFSGIIPSSPIGVASGVSGDLAAQPVWFLLSPTWSIDDTEVVRTIREHAVQHRLDNPGHRFIFVCNDPAEVARLQESGEAAFLFNKTAMVNEGVFRPLWGVRREFDAIYNAQLVGWKRHELSLGVGCCGFLFYRASVSDNEAAEEKAIRARHAELAPGHVFINAVDAAGRPVRLSPRKVNRHLNRAAVGLCLSEVEGAMFASTEFLLAGLPLVTTPSRGGRDVYFDPEFCLTVPPDPRSVAEAVDALKARAIPAAHIRTRTLERLDSARKRFLDLLNTILVEAGEPPRFGAPWPFRKKVTMEWQPMAVAAERLVRGEVDGFEPVNSNRFAARAGRWVRRLAPGVR